MPTRPRSWEVTFVRLETPLNVETTLEVKRELSPVLRRPGHVVLDLRKAIVDSSGVGALLGMQRVLQGRGRRLLVVATDPKFLDLLQRAGVPRALALFSDTEEAVRFAADHPVN